MQKPHEQNDQQKCNAIIEGKNDLRVQSTRRREEEPRKVSKPRQMIKSFTDSLRPQGTKVFDNCHPQVRVSILGLVCALSFTRYLCTIHAPSPQLWGLPTRWE